jgi:NUMOD3 motif
MQLFQVFKVTNSQTGKVFFGKSAETKKRLLAMQSDARSDDAREPMAITIAKEGRDNFTYEIIDSYTTDKEAGEALTNMINLFDSTNPEFGYNQKVSGAEVRYSDQLREKISQSLMGHVVTAETASKISEALTGKVMPDEQKEKISQSLMGSHNAAGSVRTEQWKAENSARMMGHEVSEETRRKISEANIGRTHTEESKLKMSEGHKGRVVSEETRAKMSEAHMGNKSNLGRSMPLEVREKISIANKGKTSEKRQKANEAKVGKEDSDEVKMIKSQAAKDRWARYREEKAKLAQTQTKE